MRLTRGRLSIKIKIMKDKLYNFLVLSILVPKTYAVQTIDLGKANLLFTPPEINDIITFAIRALFVVAGLLALLYLLLGGIAWITSGGNKESVDKARDKIQAAVVGLIVIVSVLAIVTLLERVLNIGLGLSMSIRFPTLIP